MKNVGFFDRIVRLIVAAVLAVVIISSSVNAYVNIFLFVMASFLTYTALSSNCPLYKAFGKSTAKK